MLPCFDFARELDAAGVAVRIAVTFICGGLIGLEREYKRRPAGFRTHILICLGAAVCALTSQYLYRTMGMKTDILRLGAQVMVGLGIIGAGSIIVTKQQRVRGLTTAAGLWTAAVIGIAAGAGYVEAAVLGTALVLATEIILTKLEHRLTGKQSDVNLYVEYARPETLDEIVHIVHEHGLGIGDLKVSRPSGDEGKSYGCAVLSLNVSKRLLDEELMKSISTLSGILSVEEL